MAFRLVPKSETLNDLRRHNVITLKILDCKANCIELVEDRRILCARKCSPKNLVRYTRWLWQYSQRLWRARLL